jgi:hypothetical protein
MNKKPESMTYEQWTNEKRKRRLLKRQEKEEAKIDRAIKDHIPFIVYLNPLFSVFLVVYFSYFSVRH